MASSLCCFLIRLSLISEAFVLFPVPRVYILELRRKPPTYIPQHFRLLGYRQLTMTTKKRNLTTNRDAADRPPPRKKHGKRRRTATAQDIKSYSGAQGRIHWTDLPAELRARILHFVFLGTTVWYGRVTKAWEELERSTKAWEKKISSTQPMPSMISVQGTPWQSFQVDNSILSRSGPVSKSSLRLFNHRFWYASSILPPYSVDTSLVYKPPSKIPQPSLQLPQTIPTVFKVAKAFATHEEIVHAILSAANIKVCHAEDARILAAGLTAQQKHMKKCIQIEDSYPDSVSGYHLAAINAVVGSFSVHVPTSRRVYLSTAQPLDLKDLLQSRSSHSDGGRASESMSLGSQYTNSNISQVEAETMLLTACTEESTSKRMFNDLG